MGGLIPNDHDKDVSRRLDDQFSDPHLGNLRNRIHGPGATEPYFLSDPGNVRHLARISHRLKIHPHPVVPPPPHEPTELELKARWQYFLQTLLTNPVTAAQNGTCVAEVIRQALEVYVVTDDPKCTAITFEAIPNDGTLPPGIDYRAHFDPDPFKPRGAVAYVADIKLMCRTEIKAGVSAPDPVRDNGEVPPDQPAL